MEKLIGRDAEQQNLAKYVNSGKAEFITIYGRRRVGKTFLVRSFFKDKFDFYATGIIDGTKEEEMKAFNDALHKYGYEGDEAANWMDAFINLGKLLKSKSDKNPRERVVVFIDELPCFDTYNSGFIHALDYFWNSNASWMSNIFLVVCGSATSWMLHNVINNRGGLYGRTTHEIHLRPFTLSETETYLKEKGSKLDRLSILQLYMTLGGIPYYISMVDPHKSAVENIDSLFFAESEGLKSEYGRLFKSLYKNPDNYTSVIRLLSEHSAGMTRKEIAEKLKIHNNGHLGEILENLESCDFIRYYRNNGKQNNGIYQLLDFFILFYNKFCRRRTTDERFWQNNINTPAQNTWYGLTFEKVCIAHYRQILRALKIDGIHTEFYSWRSKTSSPAAQIDIVIDRADGIINICEAKYSRREYRLQKTEYDKLSKRIDTFCNETKCKKGIQTVLITTNGLADNEYSNIADRVIALDDLFL